MQKRLVLVAAPREAEFRPSLAALCARLDCDVVDALTCSALVQIAHDTSPDLLVVSARLEAGQDGFEAVCRIRPNRVGIPCILIAKYSSESLAIKAIKAGIDDYFTDRCSPSDLAASVMRCLSGSRRSQTNQPLDRARPASTLIGEAHIIGDSRTTREIREYIAKVAPAQSNVLITGETGTGKELAADLIHRNSRRAGRPMVAINCAAIPDSLVESELFGYERGAFTGAQSVKEGQLKSADGGTVFLDEIGDMSLCAQAKILRAIEGKSVQRLGATRSVPVDVRVIAATNQNLERSMADGQFRKDLYYRIHIARLHMPPLRERKEDLPALLDHFIAELNERFNRNVEGVTAEAMDLMFQYSWPGNVRELKNVLEAAFVNLPARQVSFIDLPEPIRAHIAASAFLPQAERERLVSALCATNWNKSRAAQRLQWSRMTLYRKMAKYRLDRGGRPGVEES